MQAISKAKFKLVQNLSKKSFRKKHQAYIVEGYTMVDELLQNHPEQIEFIVITEKYKDLKTIENLFVATDKEFQELSTLSTPDGILAVCKIQQTQLDLNSAKKLVLLNNISDPGNLGTIIRTANWFNVDYLLLTKNSVDCFNPKVVQASMGALFRLPVVFIDDIEQLMQKLKNDKFTSIGLSLNGNSNLSLQTQEKLVLIFGSESHGIPNTIESQIDYLYKIPGNPQVESLNLSISAGIAMHQFFK